MLVVGATLVVVVVVLVVVVLVLEVDGGAVMVGPLLVGEAAVDAVAMSTVEEPDPHAATAMTIAAASNVVRITETTVPDRCDATLAP